MTAVKILLVEDDLDIVEMLVAYFRVQGYEIAAVTRGEEALEFVQQSQPNLVILDIRLPGIDGYEVARRIRANHRTRPIPIIFLSEKKEHADLLEGLEAGAEDYIPKPFDVQELGLRVRNTLRRANQDSLTNPVTSLPDGRLVDEHLKDLAKKPNWAAMLITLGNLDLFKEAYGFVASDDVLRAVSLMVANILRDVGDPSDFVGHLGPGDLILLTTREILPLVQERIRLRIEQSLDYFYPIKDRDLSQRSDQRLEVKISVITAGDVSAESMADLRSMLMKRKS